MAMSYIRKTRVPLFIPPSGHAKQTPLDSQVEGSLTSLSLPPILMEMEGTLAPLPLPILMETGI